MTRTFALLLVAALAACKSTSRTDKAQSGKDWAPKFEQETVLWEALDDSTGKRIGFVEKTTYNDGSVIYWVTGPDRNVKQGYMLPNNQGYRYVWVAGVRSKDAEFIGADTFQANARKILDYASPVRLQQIAWEELLKESEASKGGGTKE
jgi:hypothetical protein